MITLHVYGLYDPRTNALRYIGKAHDIRMRQHLHNGQAQKAITHTPICTPFELWLGELKKLNLKPVLEILMMVENTRSGRHDWLEADLIERLSEYHELLNIRYNPHPPSHIPGHETKE